MPDPKLPQTTDSEARFTLKIQECQFEHLSLESLMTKLSLLHKLGFTKFYTIVDERKP